MKKVISSVKERRISYPWEEALVKKLKILMLPEDKAHNYEHLEAVVERVLQIRQEPEFANQDVDDEVLRAGTYLHDVGYYDPSKMVSVDSYEHIEEGIELAKSLLPKVSFPKKKIADVLYLIDNHDNAKWSIPNLNLPNHEARRTEEEIKKHEEKGNPDLRQALLILKEADSAEYTDIQGIERALYYSELKGILIKANPNVNDPLNENTLSNLFIFPHLAWLNSTTEKGKLTAVFGYLRTEAWVKQYCQQYNIPYTPDKEAEEIKWALEVVPDEVPDYLRSN